MSSIQRVESRSHAGSPAPSCDGVAVVTGLTLSYACMATCLRRRRIRWRSRSDAPPQTPWSIWLFSA